MCDESKATNIAKDEKVYREETNYSNSSQTNSNNNKKQAPQPPTTKRPENGSSTAPSKFKTNEKSRLKKVVYRVGLVVYT